MSRAIEIRPEFEDGTVWTISVPVTELVYQRWLRVADAMGHSLDEEIQYHFFEMWPDNEYTDLEEAVWRTAKPYWSEMSEEEFAEDIGESVELRKDEESAE